MNRREKFIKTVRRELEFYIPFEFNLCPSLEQEFKTRTGATDYRDYYDMPLRFISVASRKKDKSFNKYFKDVKGEIFINDWGVGSRKGDFEHFSEMVSPMKNFTDIKELESYPYPDPVADYKWDSFSIKVKQLKEKDCITAAGMATTIFEIAWYLRGMEEFMIDLVLNPDLANYHLDRITDIRCEMAQKYAKSGVDILHVGDDVATQLDMMISPKLWRQYIKPRLSKVINSARKINPEIIVDYHSDGNIQTIIPELIEVGVDILNPIQPECMDPIEIKRKYGDRLSFRGTIGTQSTMPFGTPEEVEMVCKKMIEEVGKSGGFILAPTHMLEPEVPWENIEAMIGAIKKYSR